MYHGDGEIDTQKRINFPVPVIWEYYDYVAKEDTFGLAKGWYEDASNWKTFNQFFARRLKNPEVRPIASPNDESVVVSPADACTQGVWQIDNEGYIIGHDEPGVQIKSKKFNSIAELVGPNSQYHDAFNGGTLTHSFLNVYDYLSSPPYVNTATGS